MELANADADMQHNDDPAQRGNLSSLGRSHDEKLAAPEQILEDLEIDIENGQDNNLQSRTSVAEDDDELVASLTLNRKVVRSLALMPPSVRQSWATGDNLSSKTVPTVTDTLTMPASVDPDSSLHLFSDQNNELVSDHQRMADPVLDIPPTLTEWLANMNDVQEQPSSPDDSQTSSYFKHPGGYVVGEMKLNGVELSFEEEPAELFTATFSKNSMSLQRTESTDSDDGVCGIPECSMDDSPKPKTCKKLPSHKSEQHIRWCGHGQFWTTIAILAAMAGSYLAVVARRSTSFAILGKPMDVAPIYEGVDTLGMLQMQVCYNETVAFQTGCETFDLKAEDIDDAVFEIARILVTLGAVLGVFFSMFLLSATFWETINLKPVGFGFLVVYFCQAFAMLFFDTDICHEHDCQMGMGCIYCMMACVCWIVACLATAKMDTQKARFRRRRRRRAIREARQQKRARQQQRAVLKKPSIVTEGTASSDGSDIGDPQELASEGAHIEFATDDLPTVTIAELPETTIPELPEGIHEC
jgi:hypothetical protein